MRIVPQNRMRPFSGVPLYNFSFSRTEVIADYTEVIVYFDLILAASAYSVLRKVMTRASVSFAGM